MFSKFIDRTFNNHGTLVKQSNSNKKFNYRFAKNRKHCKSHICTKPDRKTHVPI